MNPQNFHNHQRLSANGSLQGQHPLNYGIPARITYIYSANSSHKYFDHSTQQFLEEYIRNTNMSLNPVWRGYQSAYMVSYAFIQPTQMPTHPSYPPSTST
jgi:hypothetical protein